MKENFLIKIVGTQLSEGEKNSIELTTRGSFVRRGESYYISYRETAATGYEACCGLAKPPAN